MEINKYREYLHGRTLPSDRIEKILALIGDFTQFFTDCGSKETAKTAGKVEVDRYARKLITEGRNTLENFSFLRDYAGWLGNRKLYVALIEVMDCHDALEVLAAEVEKRYSREMGERIFSEPLPPLGANEKERWAYTRDVMKRMSQQIPPEERREAWFQVQHGIPAHAWHESDLADREKFQQCGNIDEFLNFKRQERDAMLTRLRDENKLWYTVVIDDEVLEFVKNDPEMEVGERKGDRIYISKIPYNSVRYLHETDARMKRYYACHCPLLREAILQDHPVSPEACNCSLGHASHYLAGLGQELKGEVLESAIKGDNRCRFVFYLPDKR